MGDTSYPFVIPQLFHNCGKAATGKGSGRIAQRYRRGNTLPGGIATTEEAFGVHIRSVDRRGCCVYTP